MKILVLGINGMLGHVVMRTLFEKTEWETHGVVRNEKRYYNFKNIYKKNIHFLDVENDDSLINLFSEINPNVVINCVGRVKQLTDKSKIMSSIFINSLFPHKLAKICKKYHARLIHPSTDCVFSGNKGMYKEKDIPDSIDIYGRTKFLGELYYKNSITLRTSFIGHQISSNYGLLEWFLSQNHSCKGFSSSIYSGLPTIEVANIIKDHVIPNVNLYGLYHLSGNLITKYDLLKLIAKIYKKKILIIKSDEIQINRSLDSSLFNKKTGYNPPNWKILIEKMYNYRWFANV